MAAIEDFADLVPPSLRDKPGRVFYSGRKAFESPSKLYVLGVNSGGNPEISTDTLGDNIEKLKCSPEMELWSRYEEGGDDFHRRVLCHLFNRLKLDPRVVPASNLVFLRSQSEEKLGKAEIRRLARKCWRFHEEVIRRLEVRVVVCLGKRNCSELVRDYLDADSNPVDSFKERNKRGYKGFTYRNRSGISVVQLTHPSRFWTSKASVPTELVERALEHSNHQL